MNTHFLMAEWNHLVMANYVVPKEILLSYVPAKTSLDLYKGEAYLSLVGFMFLNTRIQGLGIPFHINFEEVNLRFYIRYNNHGCWKRGVVFIKEIVPRHGVSFVANSLFGEKYETLKMEHYHHESSEYLENGYEWLYKNKWNRLSATSVKKSSPIGRASQEEFIADHYWGYTKHSETETYEYEVEHPVWETFKVVDYSVDCDFGLLYGEEFSFLKDAEPRSVYMLKGSEIRIHKRRLLT